MKKSILAPIAIFAYNRPRHLERLLESLSQNPELSKSSIYFFCDGPRNALDTKDTERVTEICYRFEQAAETNVLNSPHNKGLADSIVSGVTSVLQEHDTVIVLEDDLVVSPGFLDYMNSALRLYREEPRVFHVSGYWFPVPESESLPETFFYNTGTCWGWATWARAWKHYCSDAIYLKSEILKRDPNFDRFNLLNSCDFCVQLEKNIKGEMRTWAIKWYASMFLHDGFSLHPRLSLVNNLGHDGTGENCVACSCYKWKQLAPKIQVELQELSESMLSRQAMIRFYRRLNRNIFRKIYDAIRQYFQLAKTYLSKLIHARRPN